jgi:MSHA pilin protein MshA
MPAYASPPPAAMRGVTLVELVAMLLVIAVLAAVALPRYADVQGKAREAKVRSAAGAMQAVASLVRSSAEARGIDCDDKRRASMDIDGQPQPLAHCYPVAEPAFDTGILAAARLEREGWVASLRREEGRTSLVLEASDALTPARCAVSYALPTRAAEGAIIATETRGC